MLQMRNLCNSRGWGRYVAEWGSLSRAIPAGRWADSSLEAGLTRPFGNVFMGESTVEKTPTSDWEDHHCRAPPRPRPLFCEAVAGPSEAGLCGQHHNADITDVFPTARLSEPACTAHWTLATTQGVLPSTAEEASHLTRSHSAKWQSRD